MCLFFNCLLIWNILSAFAKAGNSEISTLDNLENDETLATVFDQIGLDDLERSDGSVSGNVSNDPDSFLTALNPTSSTENVQNINIATPTVDDKLMDPIPSYTIAQLGDSLFNPIGWLVQGIEIIYSGSSTVWNLEGNVISSGAVIFEGTTIYFIKRWKRKINGKVKDDNTAVSDAELEEALSKLRCPKKKVCKARSKTLPGKHYKPDTYTRTAKNIVPMFIDGVFNDVILGFQHLVCYCCDDIGETKSRVLLGVSELFGRRCTVQIYTFGASDQENA